MNAEDSLKLARRFIGLPLEKRQMFLAALHKEGVDFAGFPFLPALTPRIARRCRTPSNACGFSGNWTRKAARITCPARYV
jgi:hypothetical protein